MKLDELVYLERKIVIGLISNTKFLEKVIELINVRYVNSKEAQLIMLWCFEHYKKYKRAPKRQIQDIYISKLRETNIPKKKAELIEEILESLSDEFEKDSIDIEYLTEQTVIYSKTCKLNAYIEEIQDKADSGDVIGAESLIDEYTPPEDIQSSAVIPLNSSKQIKEAFDQATKPLIRYPGDLGDLLNYSMTRESFVAFMGQSKGGKSWFLLDAMFRSAKQGRKVVFVQCGDMSQAQTERRQGIYLYKKSDMKKYCGTQYIPVMDCIHNQNGNCEEKHREDPDGEFPFDGLSKDEIVKLTKHDLIQAMEEYPDHLPCYECKRRKMSQFKGTIWYKVREPVTPLTWKDLYKLINKKHKHVLSNMRIITYPSEMLTMAKLNQEVDILEKTGFTPDVLILDYIDLVAADNDTRNEQRRDQINYKWQRSRRLSQERKILFLTVTQSDAQGFNKQFLTKDNFNNDKRCLDHVTAMFGINISRNEKMKGIYRINDIAGRETEEGYVNVLQRLQIGRPILGSYY